MRMGRQHAEQRSALRSIGRIPRVLSLVWVLLSGVFVATTFPAIWYVTFPMFIPALVSFILSIRIRAWIEDGILNIRSYFQTISLPLKDVEFFGVDDYVGLWTMGQPAMLVGLAQLDVTMQSGRRSKGLLATLSRAQVARTLADQLNGVVEVVRKEA